MTEENGHIEKIDLSIANQADVEPTTTQPTPQELLDAIHEFPCEFLIKVIGTTKDNFIGRVIEAIVAVELKETDVSYTSRETAGGRHTSVSITVIAQTSEHVMKIYAAIREVHGVVMVM
jgi:uncharacterized protein